jgi:hypothetical protein
MVGFAGDDPERLAREVRRRGRWLRQVPPDQLAQHGFLLGR